MINFSAGPSVLHSSVYQKIAHSIIDFNHTGESILALNHRSEAFAEMLFDTKAILYDLLNLNPRDYEILFLQGGASMEFLRIPLNFLKKNEVAAYVDSGIWSNKAIQVAQQYGKVEIVGSSKDCNYTELPKIDIKDEAYNYLHFTSNNTIYGTQYLEDINSSIPLICDMSSDILGIRRNFSQYDVIYAGAQKNLGVAGISVVIINNSFLEKSNIDVVPILSYRANIEANNLYNTPNVFGIYSIYENLKWLKTTGGIADMHRINVEKAHFLYQEIDRNALFKGYSKIEDRSIMNATFFATNENIEQNFIQFAKENNIIGIKGHRTLGGFRVSMYNAISLDNVKMLVDVMQAFENKV